MAAPLKASISGILNEAFGCEKMMLDNICAFAQVLGRFRGCGGRLGAAPDEFRGVRLPVF